METESKPAHSPGPWTASEQYPYSAHNGEIIIYHDPPISRSVIKRVYTDDQGRHRTQLIGEAYVTAGHESETAPNGTLFAAAPDLLAALKRLHENWCVGGYSGPDDPRASIVFSDRTISIWRDIVAAIDKAEGRNA